jgi:RHS repeat-associated protein
MTIGTNDIGETSEYVFNGLGYLVKNVWTVKQNAYGYTNITVTQIEASLREDLLVISDPSPGNSKNKKDKMTPAQVNGGGGNLNKTTVITKNFVLDYTNPLQRVIMETETGGFTYRYVYGMQKLSVVISPVNKGGGGLVQNNKVKLWYHIDRLGSVNYMSDNVSGKVASYIDYDEWGLPLKKNVLKLDARELDMAIDYTGHAWDAVLGLYYAKARMYDAGDRRFMAVDWISGTISNPLTLLPFVIVV